MKIVDWPLDRILQEVTTMENESKQIKFDLAKLCWFMRGGLSITEAYDLSSEEREIMSTLVKENLDTAKKTGQPFW